VEEQAMPVVKELDTPIRYTPISGPGVDALEARKEYNNNSRTSAAELRTSFNKVRDGVFAGLRALTEAVKA
jgi:hypothetical protein